MSKEIHEGGASARAADLLERASDALDRLARAVVVTLLAALTCALFISIVVRILGRYTENVVWIEEVSRYGGLWIAMLGATLAAKRRQHIVVTTLLDALPKAAAGWLSVVVMAVTLAFTGSIVWLGTDLAVSAHSQTGTLVPVTLDQVYAIIPVSAAIMFVHLLDEFRGLIGGRLGTDALGTGQHDLM